MNKNYKKIIDFFGFVCLLLFGVVIALNRSLAFATVDGINMFAFCILPSLFPYFIITKLISNTNSFSFFSKKFSPLSQRLFAVNGQVCSCYFLSLFSGYPMGAKCISDLYLSKSITEKQAQKGAFLCSTPSPTFLINSVGTVMLGSTKFGLTLFLSAVVSSIIIGVIFSFYSGRKTEKRVNNEIKETKDFSTLFFGTVDDATTNVLYVGGIIVVFYLLTEILLYLNVLTPVISFLNLLTGNEKLSEGIAVGLFESSKGIKIVSALGVSKTALPIISGICGFGGISVLMQSAVFFKKTKIKIAPFIFSKIVGAIVYFTVGYVISCIFL